MFDFCAGYNATWDDSWERPVKNPPPRVFPGGHPLYDEQEWLRGYDAGLECAKEWREGRKAGLANEPYDKDRPQAWRSGHNQGERTRLKRQLVPILKSAGKLGLVVLKVSYGYYDDIHGEGYDGGESYEPLKKSELLNACIEFFTGRYASLRPIPKTVEDMVAIYQEENDSEWGCCRVVTRQQAKKEKAEAEYKRIEEAAQHFAASCGHKLGTVAFIKALRKAVFNVRAEPEQWNSAERRMEEWAACRYAGVGTEVYFDDLNFENGRYSERLASLRDVWDYLHRKCPIMMLRFREARARKKRKG
jgi:hypothetical protein